MRRRRRAPSRGQRPVARTAARIPRDTSGDARPGRRCRPAPVRAGSPVRRLRRRCSPAHDRLQGAAGTPAPQRRSASRRCRLPRDCRLPGPPVGYRHASRRPACSSLRSLPSPTSRRPTSSGARRRGDARGGRTRLRSRIRHRDRAGQAVTGAAAADLAGTENVEQLVRKLYGPLVRRIKAELLLDRERRGIRIDGI